MEYAQQPPQLKSNDSSPPREFVWVLHPESDVRERIDHQQFMDFVESVLFIPISFFEAQPPGPGFDLQIACAVVPGEKMLLELQTQPNDVPPHLLFELRIRLEQAPRPSVRNGPVALASRSQVWGGCAPAPNALQHPFAVMFWGREGPLDDLLMEAAGRAPDAEWPGGENPFADLGN